MCIFLFFFPFCPHRLSKPEKPNQEKPEANQASADVIIEEVIDEQQEDGRSGFVQCLYMQCVYIHLNVWCFIALPLAGPELAKRKSRSFWKRRNRSTKIKDSEETSNTECLCSIKSMNRSFNRNISVA